MEKENNYGKVIMNDPVIKGLISSTTRSCYGVINIAIKRPLLDRVYDIITQNQNSGVELFKDELGYYHVEIYVVLQVGLPIANVCREIQKRIKYDLLKYADINVKDVSVFVDDIRKLR